MGEHSYLNLLIIFAVLGQAIVVHSEDSIDASSALHLRQKRASKSFDIAESKPKETSSSNSSPEKRGYLHPPRPGLEVGSYNPGHWEGRLYPGMVRIYHGNKLMGLGVVATPTVFVTKAHILPDKILAGEFHAEYADQHGDTVSHDIVSVRKCLEYKEDKQKPWGTDDVCFVTVDEDQFMPVVRPVSAVLKATRLFTRKQFFWIFSRTGCSRPSLELMR